MRCARQKVDWELLRSIVAATHTQQLNKNWVSLSLRCNYVFSWVLDARDRSFSPYRERAEHRAATITVIIAVNFGLWLLFLISECSAAENHRWWLISRLMREHTWPHLAPKQIQGVNRRDFSSCQGTKAVLIKPIARPGYANWLMSQKCPWELFANMIAGVREMINI